MSSHGSGHAARAPWISCRPNLSVLLVVLLTTGCRLSEARQMQPQHVNLSTGAWLQPKTKNGKPHTTYLPTQAREAIALLPHSEDFIFDGLPGQCWSLNGAGKAWQSSARPMLGLAGRAPA